MGTTTTRPNPLRCLPPPVGSLRRSRSGNDNHNNHINNNSSRWWFSLIEANESCNNNFDSHHVHGLANARTNPLGLDMSLQPFFNLRNTILYLLSSPDILLLHHYRKGNRPTDLKDFSIAMIARSRSTFPTVESRLANDNPHSSHRRKILLHPFFSPRIFEQQHIWTCLAPWFFTNKAVSLLTMIILTVLFLLFRTDNIHE